MPDHPLPDRADAPPPGRSTPAQTWARHEPATTDGDGPVTAEVLVAQMAAGDAEAFESLYALVATRVFGLCLRLIRDRAIAEEVTQEALLTIWQQSSRFDPARGSAVSWILTIAHRKAVDRIRHDQAERLRDGRYGHATHEIAVDMTAENAIKSDESARVRRVLSEMKEVHRHVLTLAYFDGMTHTQIAAYLHLPLGTAKSRIRDALISLRTTLQVA